MTTETVLSMIGFNLVGGLITWFAASYYYVKAAKELKNETDRVQNLLRISIQAMEDAGMVTPNRDGAGNPIGMVHHVSANATVTTAAKAHLSVDNETLEGDKR